MKKLLITLAFACSTAFAALPSTKDEVFDHCKVMGDIAIVTARARQQGLDEDDFKDEVAALGKDTELSADMVKQAQTAMVFGWLAAEKIDSLPKIGALTFQACTSSHLSRLGLK